MKQADVTQFIARFSASQQGALLALFILLSSSALAYLSLSGGLPGDFLLDDRARIVDTDVESVTIQGIAQAIMNTDSGTFGRVLPLASFFFTKALHGNEAEIFKYHNVLFHLISGLLVFWFVSYLFSSGRFAQYCPTRSPWLFGAIVASLWLLHPIQVSTVLYTVQRMTQFSLIFTLLTLICYLYMRNALTKRPRNAILPFSGVLIFMIAGLLSKENAALVSIYILLIEYFVFRFALSTGRGSTFHLAFISLICILPLSAGLIYFFTHTETLLYDYAMRPFDLTDRIATEAVVMWRYVGMLLIPRLSNFSLYHDGISIETLFSLKSIIAIVLWFALLAALFLFRKTAPVFVFGISFFLISHILESTILPLELMFEHRNYAGSIGILITFSAMVLGLRYFLPAFRAVSFIVVATLVLGFSAMQAARAGTWADPYIHSIIAAEENPSSSRATSSLANNQARRGQIEEAKQIMRTAIDNRPHDGQLSGMYLHLLMFHCHDETIPNDILRLSLESLKSDPASAYAVNALKILRENIIKDRCPTLSRTVLLLLESSGAGNDRTRREYRMFLNGMAGVTSVELGHYKAARIYFDEALRYADHVTKVTQRDFLVAYVRACISDKDQACADDILARARRVDDELVPMMPSHKLLPRLEKMYEETFMNDRNESSSAS